MNSDLGVDASLSIVIIPYCRLSAGAVFDVINVSMSHLKLIRLFEQSEEGLFHLVGSLDHSSF